jgi:hypothetical protein
VPLLAVLLESLPPPHPVMPSATTASSTASAIAAFNLLRILSPSR